MGPKRKPQIQKQTGNISSPKLRTIKCADGNIFMMNDILISKYSNRLKRKIQQFKADEILQLDNNIDKQTFKYIQQFINIRKDKQVQSIHYPIKSNINLRYIMDQQQALLMQKIDQEGGMKLIKNLLQISTYLQIQQLRKRLFCLIAIKLSTKTLDDLKNIYQIPQNIQANEDQLKLQMKSHLESIKKNQQKKIEEQ